MTQTKSADTRGTNLRSSRLVALALFVGLSTSGAWRIVSATNSQLDTVRRDSVATAALSEPSPGFENYLLVGSDSREGSDPSDPDR